jgi:hypothetical protein
MGNCMKTPDGQERPVNGMEVDKKTEITSRATIIGGYPPVVESKPLKAIWVPDTLSRCTAYAYY